MSPSSSSLHVTLHHPSIGAEVTGINLRETLPGRLREQLRALLIKHKVLFFRDQDMDSEQFFAFATSFGEPERPLFNPSQEPMEELYSDAQKRHPGTNNWHTDWSSLETPTMGIVLHALEIPEVGGDTLFADMTAAYRGLPETIRKQIDGLTAIHDTRPYIKSHIGTDKAFAQRDFEQLKSREHPVVRTHPESGEKILYVNKLFTQAIKGLPEQESRELLDYLCAQATVPEYQVRFRWRRNSVVLLDNRSTQHYACADYWPAVRRLQRVVLAGDKPF